MLDFNGTGPTSTLQGAGPNQSRIPGAKLILSFSQIKVYYLNSSDNERVELLNESFNDVTFTKTMVILLRSFIQLPFFSQDFENAE